MSADALIKGFEGFSEEPFWDHKQWSWGYGTNADPEIQTRTIDQLVLLLKPTPRLN